MSFQPGPSIDKKRISYILAITFMVLGLMIAGGSLWIFFQSAVLSSFLGVSTPTSSSNRYVPPSSTATAQGNAQSISVNDTSTALPAGVAVTATPASGGNTRPTATVSTNATTKVGITPTPTRATTIGPLSPSLLYGTNLSLYGGNDQALTAPIAPLLAQMHVGIVRIPMRAGFAMSTYSQLAQMVKSVGAVPLVILETPETYPTALSDDAQVIAIMNGLFGSRTYYEYGNEPDLNNNDPSSYVASWNKNVPGLRKLANGGHMVGPSTYYANFTYIQSFLAGAKPTPEFISWHEYTCDASWAASICISHLDNWTVHISKIRSIMSSTIGTTLPIMITEWNYTPAASVAGDGKHDNASFMSTWTTKALQVLAANKVYAAMQYSCTDTLIPLIDANNNLTVQGAIFKQKG